ncbi:MAG: hypothetical protein AABY22_17145 [Nanoarchaeota archaeon]
MSDDIELEDIKTLLKEISTSASDIEHACIRYNEAKAKLQLEIYKLIKANKNTDDIMKIIANSADILDNSTDTKKTISKFFREK